MDPHDVLRVLVAAVRSDGEIKPAEQAAPAEAAEKHGVSEREVNRILARKDDSLDDLKGRCNEGEFIAALQAAIFVAAADGRICKREQRFLYDLGERWGIPRKIVQARITGAQPSLLPDERYLFAGAVVLIVGGILGHAYSSGGWELVKSRLWVLFLVVLAGGLFVLFPEAAVEVVGEILITALFEALASA